MKYILLVLVVSFNLSANIINDGWTQYNKGNKLEASKLWEQACDSKNISGCYLLGMMYVNGKGVKQNKSKAKELFGKACDLGYIDGCQNYKILDEQGIK